MHSSFLFLFLFLFFGGEVEKFFFDSGHTAFFLSKLSTVVRVRQETALYVHAETAKHQASHIDIVGVAVLSVQGYVQQRHHLHAGRTTSAGGVSAASAPQRLASPGMSTLKLK